MSGGGMMILSPLVSIIDSALRAGQEYSSTAIARAASFDCNLRRSPATSFWRMERAFAPAAASSISISGMSISHHFRPRVQRSAGHDECVVTSKHPSKSLQPSLQAIPLSRI